LVEEGAAFAEAYLADASRPLKELDWCHAHERIADGFGARIV